MWMPVDARVDDMPACQQGGARRAAYRLHVIVVECDARIRESIEVGCRNLLRPVKADIIPTEVIRLRVSCTYT